MSNRTPLLAAVATALIVACGPKDATTDSAAPSAPPNVVTFTALDYAFEGPVEIPAGPTTFRLDSKGQQIHHMTIVRLAEGKTVDSVKAALANPGPPPQWMTFIGGPNAPAPGGQSNATIDMQAGNYAILCFVDTPDHVPHMAKGMMRALTVTPAAPGAAVAAMPEPSLTMTLADYSFMTDKPLAAGKHTIKVVNAGPQPHEIEIIRLDEGKTPEDMITWGKTMQGPPPGAPVGGVAPILPGQVNLFEVDLAPGTYLLTCFLPAPDQKLHFEHGMIQTITVQ